jgi:enamine deaminase RidA (YjgF/YER057c/UK114 family)
LTVLKCPGINLLRETNMQRESINPWTWQEALGFVHANKVSGSGEILFMSGQTASDANGRTLFPGDMSRQIEQTLANIGTILQQGGMDFSHVVRLNIYTTDLGALLASHDHMVQCMQQLNCTHAGTLLAVSGLAAPGALIEMEVTAAK